MLPNLYYTPILNCKEYLWNIMDSQLLPDVSGRVNKLEIIEKEQRFSLREAADNYLLSCKVNGKTYLCLALTKA